MTLHLILKNFLYQRPTSSPSGSPRLTISLPILGNHNMPEDNLSSSVSFFFGCINFIPFSPLHFSNFLILLLTRQLYTRNPSLIFSDHNRTCFLLLCIFNPPKLIFHSIDSSKTSPIPLSLRTAAVSLSNFSLYLNWIPWLSTLWLRSKITPTPDSHKLKRGLVGKARSTWKSTFLSLAPPLLSCCHVVSTFPPPWHSVMQFLPWS